MRELGLEAECSIIYVKVDRDCGCNVLRDLVRQRFVVGWMNSRRLEFASNLALVCSVEVENRAENFSQLLRRDVSSAGDNPPFIVQESGCRPTPHVLTSIDIGSVVRADFDGNEILVNKVNDGRTGVERVVDNVDQVQPRTAH